MANTAAPVHGKLSHVYMAQEFIEQTNQVKTCGHAADWTGEHIIEHQGGNRKLRQRGAHRLFHDSVHSAADEHTAALDVEHRHRRCEQHDYKYEPRCRLAYEVLGNCARVEGGRTHIVQNDCGDPPERDERQHGTGCDEYSRSGISIDGL